MWMESCTFPQTEVGSCWSFKEYVTLLQNETSNTVNPLRSDNGGQYISRTSRSGCQRESSDTRQAVHTHNIKWSRRKSQLNQQGNSTYHGTRQKNTSLPLGGCCWLCVIYAESSHQHCVTNNAVLSLSKEKKILIIILTYNVLTLLGILSKTHSLTSYITYFMLSFAVFFKISFKDWKVKHGAVSHI
jgi:hypothetical protein